MALFDRAHMISFFHSNYMSIFRTVSTTFQDINYYLFVQRERGHVTVATPPLGYASSSVG